MPPHCHPEFPYAASWGHFSAFWAGCGKKLSPRFVFSLWLSAPQFFFLFFLRAWCDGMRSFRCRISDARQFLDRRGECKHPAHSLSCPAARLPQKTTFRKRELANCTCNPGTWRHVTAITNSRDSSHMDFAPRSERMRRALSTRRGDGVTNTNLHCLKLILGMISFPGWSRTNQVDTTRFTALKGLSDGVAR